MHSISLAAGRRCPGFAFALAVAIVSDLASAVEEPPVERSGTGGPSTAEARSDTMATAKAKAKPGQRRPAASEIECTT